MAYNQNTSRFDLYVHPARCPSYAPELTRTPSASSAGGAATKCCATCMSKPSPLQLPLRPKCSGMATSPSCPTNNLWEWEKLQVQRDADLRPRGGQLTIISQLHPPKHPRACPTSVVKCRLSEATLAARSIDGKIQIEHTYD